MIKTLCHDFGEIKLESISKLFPDEINHAEHLTPKLK